MWSKNLFVTKFFCFMAIMLTTHSGYKTWTLRSFSQWFDKKQEFIVDIFDIPITPVSPCGSTKQLGFQTLYLEQYLYVYKKNYKLNWQNSRSYCVEWFSKMDK